MRSEFREGGPKEVARFWIFARRIGSSGRVRYSGAGEDPAVTGVEILSKENGREVA